MIKMFVTSVKKSSFGLDLTKIVLSPVKTNL